MQNGKNKAGGTFSRTVDIHQRTIEGNRRSSLWPLDSACSKDAWSDTY